MRVIFRYCLFQVPGLVLVGILVFLLQRWGVISPATAWIVIALWVLKDALLFPFTRKAYEDPPSSGPEGMIGSQGITSTDLDDRGLVVVEGERWQAVSRDGDTIPRHVAVRVTGARGMLLEVVRLSEDA